MTTERQKREIDKVITLDDHIDLLEKLSNASDNIYGKCYDETLKVAGEALKEKVKYIIDMSAPYRKKQGWFSRWKDLRREKKEYKLEEKEKAKEEKEEALKEDYEFRLKALRKVVEKQNEQLSLTKKLLHENGITLPFSAPPKAEESVKALEGEVVEDDLEEEEVDEDNNSDETHADDCMKF